jgi:hypothetical protein
MICIWRNRSVNRIEIHRWNPGIYQGVIQTIQSSIHCKYPFWSLYETRSRNDQILEATMKSVLVAIGALLLSSLTYGAPVPASTTALIDPAVLQAREELADPAVLQAREELADPSVLQAREELVDPAVLQAREELADPAVLQAR